MKSLMHIWHRFHYVSMSDDTCFYLNRYTSGMPIFSKMNDDFLFRCGYSFWIEYHKTCPRCGCCLRLGASEVDLLTTLTVDNIGSARNLVFRFLLVGSHRPRWWDGVFTTRDRFGFWAYLPAWITEQFLLLLCLLPALVCWCVLFFP